MAFGFPYAAYVAVVDLDSDRDSIREAVVQTFRSIGWEYEVFHPNKFVARIPINGSSWGEKLTVRITDDGQIEVESRCSPFPQLFDWGKNRKNVEQFIELMTAKAERFSMKRSLDRPQFDTETSTPLERALSDENQREDLKENSNDRGDHDGRGE
jgi:hypothetical protein